LDSARVGGLILLQSVRQAFGLVDISHRLWVLTFLAANVLSSFFDASGLVLVFAFFHVALKPQDIEDSQTLNTIWRVMGSPEPDAFIALLGVFVVGAFVVRTVLLLSIHWLGLKFRRRLQRRMMGQLFRIYLRRSLSWHHSIGVATIVNGLRLHVPAICANIIVGSLEMLAHFVTLCVLLATMLWLRPVETLAVVLTVISFSGGYFYLVRNKIQEWADLESQKSEDTWSAVSDPLNGIRITKVHGLEDFFSRRLDLANDVLLDVANRKSMLRTAPTHLLQTILIAGMIGVLIASISVGVDATLIIPTLILFSGAAFRVIPITMSILNGAQSIRATNTGLQQVRDAFLFRQDQIDPGPPTADVESLDRIELRDVSFSYKSGRTTAFAIRAINIRIEAGDQLALVGPSGAGKSTLVELIMGLLTPTTGEILINDIPTKRISHTHFAYVPQDTVIINDTFARNIALGDAPIDSVRLGAAISGAALEGVVDRLPHGDQTPLSQARIGLSGGERQRIGIARALYRDAPIIVMDEPTSALDALTEADVAATLAQLRGQRTVVLIAHRLSTVRNFDRIAYMEGGRILQEGSFESLYGGQPRFRAMVDLLQNGAERTFK
jgi:ATP-binding cassette, subfamily B, bacterial PglK